MIIRQIATASLIYCSLVLQSTSASAIAVYQLRPWFPAMVLVACVSLHKGALGIWWAGVLGLAIDGISGERLGVHLVIATFIASLLSSALQETPSSGALLYGIFVIVATFLWRSSNAITQAWLTGQVIDPLQTMILASGDATYTAGLILILMMSGKLLHIGIVRSEPRSTFSLNNQWTMLTRFER